MSFIVAIDGPAGTGKGTITALISKQMGLVNIDTGATYRCVALEVLNNNIKLEEKDKIIELLDKIEIDIKNEKSKQTILLNGEDVTSQIRSKEVSKIVSQVSSIVEVRLKLVELQRKLASGKDVIMEGRDIGTYVFPKADVKIYLDADEEERAKRRYKECKQKGIEMSYEEVLKNIQIRDKNDKEKEVGALKVAEDAVVIDTTKMSVNQVTSKVKKKIKEKQKEIEHRKKVYTPRPDTKWKQIEYKMVKAFLRGLYRIVYRVKKVGEENIEDDKPYIICANHINYLDAAAIVLFTKRKVCFVGKEDLCRFGILNWLAHLFDCIPIKRNAQDIEAMKRSFKVLKENGILGIFPEGTRKGLAKGTAIKNGAAFMAVRTGSTVIPVGIKGSFKPFTRVTVNYGKPLDYSKCQSKSPEKEVLNQVSEEIMSNIIMLTK